MEVKVEDGEDSEDVTEDEPPNERDGARGKDAANAFIELGRFPSVLPATANREYSLGCWWYPLVWLC